MSVFFRRLLRTFFLSAHSDDIAMFFLMGKGTTVYSHGVKWWTAEVSRYDFQHFLAVNELHMATAQNGESPKRTRQSYIHLTKHQTPAFLSVILCLLDAAC